jgi:hypothetical protein
MPTDDRPAAPSFAIHIPPEEAALLVLLLLEAVATVWQRQRAKWTMQKLGIQRNVEFAVGHDHGFTILLRQFRSRRS